MKIVIVGAGSIGFQLAKQLIDEGRDVLVLEKNPAIHRYANERLDCKVMLASGTDVEALQTAGLEKGDFFVALTDSDEINLASSYIVGAQYSDTAKIIRIRNLEYQSIPVIERSVIGPSHIVHPPRETAEAIIKTIEHGAVGDIYEFANGEIQLRSFALLEEQNKIVGRKIEELRQQSEISFLIPLLRRNGMLQIPEAKTVLQPRDTIYLAAEQSRIAELIQQFGLGVQDSRRVIILGGGEIAITVGRLLTQYECQTKPKNVGLLHNLASWLRRKIHLQRYQVKYVERDYERCKVIKTRLPKVEIVNADVSEENLFEEENLDSAHIIIAATDNQELNIVTALYAKNAGIRRAVVLVRTKQMHNVAASLGLDVIVSTGNTMVNSIMRRIHGDKVHSIQSLVDGHADSDTEIIELQVAPKSCLIGKALSEIRLAETIVTYIYRNDTTILPTGSTALQEGDRVIIIAQKVMRERLLQLFAGTGERPAAANTNRKK